MIAWNSQMLGESVLGPQVELLLPPVERDEFTTSVPPRFTVSLTLSSSPPPQAAETFQVARPLLTFLACPAP